MEIKEPAGMTIRPLDGAEEAKACARMMAETDPWITLRREFDQAFQLATNPEVEVYVARVGETLAGHIVVNMKGPFAGYIQALVVGSDWRGRGIGSQLVRFAEERIFRESPNVFLCVSSFNERAQQLYARLGYERIGELKEYVIPGASEFLMRKTIGPKTGFKAL